MREILNIGLRALVMCRQKSFAWNVFAVMVVVLQQLRLIHEVQALAWHHRAHLNTNEHSASPELSHGQVWVNYMYGLTSSISQITYFRWVFFLGLEIADCSFLKVSIAQFNFHFVWQTHSALPDFNEFCGGS